MDSLKCLQLTRCDPVDRDKLEVSMVAPLAAQAITAAAPAALEVAKKYAPGAIDAAKSYLKTSGAKKGIELLAKGGMAEQASVLTALHRGGLSAKTIDEAIRELTPEESVRWAGMVSAFYAAEAKSSDKAAVAHESSGDPTLDSAVMNAQIHKICGMLGVSSDQLGFMLTCFRTIQHSDVERYIRDYRVMGLTPR